MNTNNKLYLNIALICVLLFSINFVNAQIVITGAITTEDGDPITNIPVSLNGDIALTNEDGVYEFLTMFDSTANNSIEPYFDEDYLNGVTNLDKEIIANVLLGTDSLDSHYKYVAADINRDGNITSIDIAQLEQLLTGVILEFPSNTSWRFFYEATYGFPLFPVGPPAPGIPDIDIFSIVDIINDTMTIDFIGVKIGDVNNTATFCDESCGQISGNVYFDENENCSRDTQEQDLSGWLIKLASDSTVTYATTDQSGNYTRNLPAGDYLMTIIAPNELWTVCEDSINITINEAEELNLNVAAQALQQCPSMEVNLGTPFLRRCFDGFYNIQYCNLGTEMAEEAFVEVTFDSFLTVTNSSIPWTTQDGNTYTFDLGDVDVNECGVITVDLDISCDAVWGQTFCSEAHVFPDASCIPPSSLWDGSELELFANCDGDSVRFEVRNIGDPMTQMVNYLVIEDDMIMLTGDDDPIQLNALESRFLNFPANGSTWRIEVDQSPNYPLNDILSAATEGCGENGDGTFSLGFITQYPQYTPSDAVDVDCIQSIGSWDPNDKSAIPTGVGTEHFIERNTDLEYRIRFQNTGTDTAFTVVIKDTISTWLDLGSIRVGASSHDYEFEMLEDQVIEFRFENIMLPDSNVNEVASHGFVKFKIAQKPDNPLGTVIENDAAIYFDFNDPVITNTTFHTIGENFLDIVNNIIPLPGPQFEIKLYPNLVGMSAVLKLEGITLNDGQFLLYDLYGRLLRQESFNGDRMEFYKNQLSSGMYMFEIYEGNQRLSGGKLMIR